MQEDKEQAAASPGASVRKTPAAKLGAMRAAYAADPEKFKRRSRRYHRRHKEAVNCARRAVRAANPQSFRERESQYRDSHRQEYNARQRQRHQRKIPKVGKGVLRAARGNPAYEVKHRITAFVICRECGAKLSVLWGGAWPHLAVHGMDAPAYMEKWPGAPLVAARHREALAQRASEKALPGSPRANLASVKGHPGEGPAPRGRILELLIEGKSYAAVGKELGRSVATMEAAAHRLRPGPRNRRYLAAAWAELKRSALSAQAASGAASQRRPRGKPTAERSGFIIAKEVEGVLPAFEALCLELKALPKRARTNPKRTLALLREGGFSERQVEAASHAPGSPLEAARWFVSIDRKMPYDTVAIYHKRFRSVP